MIRSDQPPQRCYSKQSSANPTGVVLLLCIYAETLPWCSLRKTKLNIMFAKLTVRSGENQKGNICYISRLELRNPGDIWISMLHIFYNLFETTKELINYLKEFTYVMH